MLHTCRPLELRGGRPVPSRRVLKAREPLEPPLEPPVTGEPGRVLPEELRPVRESLRAGWYRKRSKAWQPETLEGIERKRIPGNGGRPEA